MAFGRVLALKRGTIRTLSRLPEIMWERSGHVIGETCNRLAPVRSFRLFINRAQHKVNSNNSRLSPFLNPV